MIIDSHTHCFTYPSILNIQDKIRTTEDVAKFRSRYPHLSLSKLHASEKPLDLVKQILEEMREHKIDLSMIQPIPGVSAQQVAEAVSKDPPRLVGLFPISETYTLPPAKYNLDNIEENVSKGIALGLKGAAEVHLGSFAEEPEGIARGMRSLLEALAKKKIPLLVHTGWSQHAGEIELRASNPIYLDSVAASFAEVPIILAHMGRGMNYFFEPAIAVALRNSNVYLDTADSISQHIKIAVDKLGPDRVLFGTDWSPTQRFIRDPMHIYKMNLTSVHEAVKNESDREWVLSKTAKSIYNL